tara:strand:+ start:1576 stop:1995 length:420 start_codon:yes stop_codon:yes gene_type:complete
MNNIPEILQDKNIKAFTKKSIKNIQLYALHTDLDVLETFSKPHFFLRKPYEGELEFAEKNYDIKRNILHVCHSVLCSSRNENLKNSQTEISFDRDCKFRTKTFFNKEDTLSFFTEVKPYFFDGIDLFIWENDIETKEHK